MTIASIVQPTFMPWLGYFDILAQSDITIFLDSVQFPRRSWVQRNRIKSQEGLQWLTVPVKKRGLYDQPICDVCIDDLGFVQRHNRAIEFNYHNAQYFETYFPLVSKALSSCKTTPLLANLNFTIIDQFVEILGLDLKSVRSSAMNGIEGKRGSLLASICEAVNADRYLTTPGAVDYLLDDLNAFTERDIAVYVHEYEHPEYTQQNPPFIPYASTLDLILNEGSNAFEILCSGRRPSTLLRKDNATLGTTLDEALS